MHSWCCAGFRPIVPRGTVVVLMRTLVRGRKHFWCTFQYSFKIFLACKPGIFCLKISGMLATNISFGESSCFVRLERCWPFESASLYGKRCVRVGLLTLLERCGVRFDQSERIANQGAVLLLGAWPIVMVESQPRGCTIINPVGCVSFL